jgi:hypothetical protein
LGFLKKSAGPAAPAQSKCVWCGAMTPENVEDCQSCGRRLRVIERAYVPPTAKPVAAAPAMPGPIFITSGSSAQGPRAAPPPTSALPTYAPQAPAAAPSVPPPAYPSETLIGIIESLAHAGANFDLVFTDRRIVGAYVGYAAAATSITGSLIGAALTAGESGRRAHYAGMSFDSVVASNKKNFWLPNELVTRGELSGGVSMVTIPKLNLWTGRKKFAFTFDKQNWMKNEKALAAAKQVLWASLGQRMVFKGV